MADKGIGFSRTVFLRWLDAAASLRVQEEDPQVIRAALEDMLEKDLAGKDARRKTIDVLLGIWDKSARVAPALHAAALRLYRNAYTSEDFIWLHYGLTLVYYPLFRHITATIGQMSRLQDGLTRKQIKERVIAEWGHLGAMDRSIERICASLTEWGLFPAAEERYTYIAAVRERHTDNLELQTWLLACALHAHPAETLLVSDLLRLPELFPFALTVGADHLRKSHWFTLYREANWVRVSLRNSG